jgi:Ca2+-binding EF-hand superfamily protein
VADTDTSKYQATFELLDTDGDGKISAAELKNLMSVIGEEITDEAAAEAVGVVDEDGDGLISLDEFSAWLDSRPAS